MAYTLVIVYVRDRKASALFIPVQQHNLVYTAGVPGGLVGGPRAYSISWVQVSSSAYIYMLVGAFSCI